MSITFSNTVFQTGYVGEDDGNPSSGFGIDNASQNPITITGTVTKVGDTVTAVGVLPGGSDTGITATTNTLTVTQYDNSGQIEFSVAGQGAAAGQPFRIVLSNTMPLTASQARVTFASDPALVNGTGGDVYVAPCFTTDTLIRILRHGAEVDVAVEALAVGDVAVTASGEHRPIRWIGHRTIDCRRYADRHAVLPVRIRAHAFGANRPARDLVVSPGHALCVDICGEVLMPAGALINGSTVVQEEAARVTYWHVELESHDILLAENMPAESYLAMGNRGFFSGTTGGEAVVELAARPDEAQRGRADFCRPFHDHGPVVGAAREQLDARAALLDRAFHSPASAASWTASAARR